MMFAKDAQPEVILERTSMPGHFLARDRDKRVTIDKKLIFHPVIKRQDQKWEITPDDVLIDPDKELQPPQSSK